MSARSELAVAIVLQWAHQQGEQGVFVEIASCDSSASSSELLVKRPEPCRVHGPTTPRAIRPAIALVLFVVFFPSPCACHRGA